MSIRIEETNQIVFQGPLYGKILPSQSLWAILPDQNNHVRLDEGEFDTDEDKRNTGNGTRKQKIQLSLEKSHGHQNIWATVLSRDYLASTQQQSNNNNNNTLQ